MKTFARMALTSGVTLALHSGFSNLVLANWTPTGDAALAKIAGDPGKTSTAVTLNISNPQGSAGLRFGPIAVPRTTRVVNVSFIYDCSVPAGQTFLFSLLASGSPGFPASESSVIGRRDFSLSGSAKGKSVSFNLPIARDNPPGDHCYIFAELKPKSPGVAAGTVTVRELDVLSSAIAPLPTGEARKRAYLDFVSRYLMCQGDSKKPNADILKLPGHLASIAGVTDPNDPRIQKFFDEAIRMVKNLRAPDNRLGPFEIFLPIATFSAAKSLLGPALTNHPGFNAFRQEILEHQSAWPDYKSCGSGVQKRQAKEAKTLDDVPSGIGNGNFQLLVMAAGLLSAQEFPELKTTAQFSKGPDRTQSSAEILREMNLYCKAVFANTVNYNLSEYGSPIYLAIDYTPIRIIAENARDPEVKKMASETLDWMFASLAASTNQGYHINSAARSKGDFLGPLNALSVLAWMNFETPVTGAATSTAFNAFMALPGKYRVPDSIRPLTRFPYVKRERIGRPGNHVWIYTYQSRSFALTSSIEDMGGDARAKNPKWDSHGFYKEGARNKLNWFADSTGGFSPQWENSAQPYAGRRNQVNGRYYGINPWSLVLQCQGTQIGLSDVRDGYPFRKLYATYPGDGAFRLRVTKPDTGWTLCHTGAMMFAFRSLKPPTLANDGKPGGPLTDWYDYKKTAWILESVEAPETKDKSDAALAAQLEAFHKRLLGARVHVTGLDDASPEKPTFTYTSPMTGKTMRLDAAVYPIPADGEGISTRNYPVLATYPELPNSPRMLHDNGVLQLFDAAGKPIFARNFTGWKVPQGGADPSEASGRDEKE